MCLGVGGVNLSVFVMIAVLVEGLTGIFKSIVQGLGFTMAVWMDQAASLVVSMSFAVAGKIDFFTVLGQVVPVQFGFPAWAGIILAGLVLSRGSNGVHDIFKNLSPQDQAENEGKEARIW